MTYERSENDNTVRKVYTISSHDYRPSSHDYRPSTTENETARLASRTVDYASTPDARGVKR